LIYPEFIDKQINILQKNDGDMVYYSFKSPLLCGQGVFSSRSIKYIFDSTKDKNDLEHVGSYFIMLNQHELRWLGLELPSKYFKNYRITVDELSDLKFIRKIYKNLWEGNNIDFDKLIDWIDSQKFQENFSVEESKINKK